jgi:hypothetical protein
MENWPCAGSRGSGDTPLRCSADQDVMLRANRNRMLIHHIAAVGSEGPAAPDPLRPALNVGLVSYTSQKPALPPPIRLEGQGVPVISILLDDRG